VDGVIGLLVNGIGMLTADELTQDIIEAIVSGRHSDVFSVLGMHVVKGNAVCIRVFLPGARRVRVKSSQLGSQKDFGELAVIDTAGLFSGVVAMAQDSPYWLEVDYPLATVVLEDAYRFPSLLDEKDCYLFNNGTQERAWHFLGANHRECDGVAGVLFALWAPNACRVAVVGDFNSWDGRVNQMRFHPAWGLWDLFIPGVSPGDSYKYEITGADGNLLPLKADPYARQVQLRPDTASVIPAPSSHVWGDGDWMNCRGDNGQQHKAISVYEVHAGSWRRDGNNGFLNYREIAKLLVPYARDLGFTHIQLLPISEHPLDGSWGYQPVGLFAPTSRFGSADDFRFFVDTAHRAGLGVLLDWVPGHFPNDEHGLARFDGTHLYEHADPRQGHHPDWDTLIFNYQRAEVISYLISNAFYWFEEFHIDGLRFDAVASMLYLDYSRQEGQWLPNYHGGRENLEAIDLLRNLNRRLYFNFTGIMTIAEESTAWPGVTNLTEQGGLGFGFKWNLGWMHDTLSYFSRDPIHRKYHHNEITFSLLYAYSEHFMLPFSHDEVVHGKRSLLERMPGDDYARFANLRACYCFMWTHPGKKLLFMGGEFAQRAEWSHDSSLDWHLLEYDPHRGIQELIRDLNAVYREHPALHDCEHSHESFEWLDADNNALSIFSYLRKNRQGNSLILTVLNLTPIAHHNFRLGVSVPGYYRELINSDSTGYGGSGMGNPVGCSTENNPSHGRQWSVKLDLPPLAALIFILEQEA